MYILPLPLFFLTIPLFLTNIYAMTTDTDAPTHNNPDAHHDTNNIQIHHQFHQNDHRDVTGINKHKDAGNSVCFGERAETAEMLRCEEPYVSFFFLLSFFFQISF